ncbi:LamG-like jellyroll fold domain-containing protein [Shewanella woodyi]|uniref:LamG-like jellyroll fold domain-containing protein n=1 Tax=Shewanella woodyi TaxID=60961 RepID=UPI003747C2D1
MKIKIALAIGIMAVGITSPLLADSMKASYSFNQANGYPGNGEQNSNGHKGYFPLSGNGKFITAGRSGLALSQDVMVVGGMAPFSKDMPLTISLWIKPTQDAASGTILSRKHSETGTGFSVAFDADMNLEFNLADQFGGAISVASLTPVAIDGMWHHIAVSYKGDADASNMGLYIDGEVTELRLASNSLSGQVETYHPLVIGGSSSYTQALAAEVDEIYLIPQVFNPEQVTCLYQLKTDCAYRPTTGQEGPRGPIGDMGDQGDRGATGASGLAGDVGHKGEAGLIGPQGPQGSQGPRGFAGPTGIAGIDGSDGSDGSDGAAGAAGAQGAVGDRGLQGPQGSKGLQGNIGAKGAIGNRGAQGAVGNKGVTGSKGARGAQGPVGYAGGAGAQGPKGYNGPTGPRGNTGLQGNQGVQGNRGPTGPRGYTGGNIFGYDGDKGPVGDRGARGPKPTVTECLEEWFGFARTTSKSSLMSLTPELDKTIKGEFKLSSKVQENELDGVIDPDFILERAVRTSDSGLMHIDLNILAIETEEEEKAFFTALDLSDQAVFDFILDIYSQKNLDNRFAVEIPNMLAAPSPLQLEKGTK